jgi:lysophospholipase L1-like esterase
MAGAPPPFSYSNVSSRPPGWFLRLTATVVPGVRKVQAQIKPYAQAWNESNAAAWLETGPLWVALGDSMSQGIGASSYDRGWVGQLRVMLEQAGTRYRLLNLSVYGARVPDVLERQLPAMRRFGSEPDLVTVLIGSNDIVSKRYRTDLARNYRALLEQLPAGTVIASPFGDFGVGREINSIIVEEAARRGFRLLADQGETGLAGWKGKLADDHFHPNDLGYAGLAQAFFNSIRAAA